MPALPVGAVCRPRTADWGKDPVELGGVDGTRRGVAAVSLN